MSRSRIITIEGVSFCVSDADYDFFGKHIIAVRIVIFSKSRADEFLDLDLNLILWMNFMSNI